MPWWLGVLANETLYLYKTTIHYDVAQTSRDVGTDAFPPFFLFFFRLSSIESVSCPRGDRAETRESLLSPSDSFFTLDTLESGA